MSIIGTFFVRVKEGGSPHTALNLGEFGSAFLMIGATYGLINFFLLMFGYLMEKNMRL